MSSLFAVSNVMHYKKYLADNGVHTLIHYPVPPHQQQAYEEWNQLSYPISEKIHAEVLSLPIGPITNESDIFKVIQILNSFKLVN